MKRGWYGLESGNTRSYTKKIKLRRPETREKYRAEILIEMTPEGKEFAVRSFRIERDPLNYREMPGSRYSAAISEHVGSVIRPMKKAEIRDFLHTIFLELDDFPGAKVEGRKADKYYLTDLRLKITADEMTRYQDNALKRLGSDCRMYNQIQVKKD